jgi:hypothetical protein
MHWLILLLTLSVAGCVSNSQAVPTGSATLAPGGAGLQPGASAGASVGGGSLGLGTDDNRAGAK